MKDDDSGMEGQASNPEQDAITSAEALNSLGGYLPTGEAEVEALDRQVGVFAGQLRAINSTVETMLVLGQIDCLSH